MATSTFVTWACIHAAPTPKNIYPCYRKKISVFVGQKGAMKHSNAMEFMWEWRICVFPIWTWSSGQFWRHMTKKLCIWATKASSNAPTRYHCVGMSSTTRFRTQLCLCWNEENVHYQSLNVKILDSFGLQVKIAVVYELSKFSETPQHGIICVRA